jgi:serine/threonine protein kinase/CHASE2 domain-containing sensor protein
MSREPPKRSDKTGDPDHGRSSLSEDQDVVRISGSKPLISIQGYRIVKWLGGGGQGEVFEAHQEVTGARVAIKVLKQSLSNSPEAKENLLHEIRLLAQLKHPNIVTIHDAGETSDGRLYFVLELLSGGALRDYVREHRLTVAGILDIMRTVCSAIDHVHTRGVVHRDLKPNNILMDAHGTPKLVDFGLARTLIDPHHLTEENRLGTLPYMTPEQVRGNPDQIDARTDVYALGVMLYELLTGDYPYSITGSIFDIFKRIQQTPPERLQTMWALGEGIAVRPVGPRGQCPIDARLESLVLKALEKEPIRRYKDGGALARNLDLYLRDEPLDPPVPGDVLRTGARRFMGKHPVVTCILAVFLAFNVSEALVSAWIYPHTQWNQLYQRQLSGWISRKTNRPYLENVRIVGRREAADVKNIARGLGMDESITDRQGGLRPIFARLLEHLAKTGCRAVVWDYAFVQATEYDVQLVDAIRNAKKSGVDVIVGARGWWLDEAAKPELSPAIAAEVQYGSISVQFDEREPWIVPLAASRGIQRAVPSLVLLAFSAYYRPGKEPQVVFEQLQQLERLLELRYASAKDRMQVWFTEPYFVPQPADARETEAGLQPGDALANFRIEVPPDDILEKATVGMEELFKPEREAALRNDLRDKVVIVGDLRSDSVDRFGYPNRGRIAGCYGLAAALDQLLRFEGTYQMGRGGEALVSMLGTILGALAALFAPYRHRSRLLVLATWTLGFIVISMLAYRQMHYVWNPAAAILGLWLAAETYAALRRYAVSGPI